METKYSLDLGPLSRRCEQEDPLELLVGQNRLVAERQHCRVSQATEVAIGPDGWIKLFELREEFIGFAQAALLKVEPCQLDAMTQPQGDLATIVARVGILVYDFF